MKSRYPVGEVILYVIRRLDGDLQGSVVRRSGPMGDDVVRVRTASHSALMGAIKVLIYALICTYTVYIRLDMQYIRPYHMRQGPQCIPLRPHGRHQGSRIRPYLYIYV